MDLSSELSKYGSRYLVLGVRSGSGIIVRGRVILIGSRFIVISIGLWIIIRSWVISIGARITVRWPSMDLRSSMGP